MGRPRQHVVPPLLSIRAAQAASGRAAARLRTPFLKRRSVRQPTTRLSRTRQIVRADHAALGINRGNRSPNGIITNSRYRHVWSLGWNALDSRALPAGRPHYRAIRRPRRRAIPPSGRQYENGPAPVQHLCPVFRPRNCDESPDTQRPFIVAVAPSAHRRRDDCCL
jgi:hypothetical protein